MGAKGRFCAEEVREEVGRSGAWRREAEGAKRG